MLPPYICDNRVIDVVKGMQCWTQEGNPEWNKAVFLCYWYVTTDTETEDYAYKPLALL